MTGWKNRLTERIREQLAVWPKKVTETIHLTDQGFELSTDVPNGGTILLFVHGFLGEGRLDVNVSGAHQAAALRAALTNEFETRADTPPTVVAVMWHSSTTWLRAKEHADVAGVSLASWLSEHGDEYDSITVVGHSLGARVSLTALAELDTPTVDSVGLLGAAVDPGTVCAEYRHGIESTVDSGVYNYHSTNDAIVCRVYRLGEGSSGLGCRGADFGDEEKSTDSELPRNYTDIDVSVHVQRHMDYFKPHDNTVAGNCVDEIVGNQLESE